MAHDEQRPDPDVLLARARAEESRRGRGRLKIFFGFAPGVGKTCAMLEAAREKSRDGRDVVIGWVETHGRRETEALAEGLKRLPPRTVDYRGRTLQEFDLDSALAQKPGLILVDEYAHTNVEGSRHTKRWQDVDDLLDAGIDVWTTLNVQHIESLNDVVAQITGVQVHETIPDSAFNRADEIELVDLPPDDLLRRLREGKVYHGNQAERAIENFFQKGNLIALRELSMRRAAERVDEEITDYKREQGIKQPWAMRERLLVAIGPSPQSANLLRASYLMASRLKAPWIALSVETPASARMGVADRERLSTHLEMAERLGAETITVSGDNPADEIMAVARARNVTRIVVGKPGAGRLGRRRSGTLVEDLIARSGSIDVLVTTGSESGEPSMAGRTAARRQKPMEFAFAVAAVGAATLVNHFGRGLFNLADQSMIYLLATLFVAARSSRLPSLIASILSVAALDFFFVEPFLTFAVTDFRHLVTFAVLLTTGLVVSGLTTRVRDQARLARDRERRTAALYRMSRDFAARRDASEIAEAAARHLSEMFETEATVALADDQGGLGSDGDPAAAGEADRRATVARWVYEHGRPAGHGTDTLPAGTDLFLPLAGANRVLGVVGVALGNREQDLSPASRQLLENAVRQTALALERARLAEEAETSRVSAEAERLRNDLLSSVSHDLRTPLAAITGAATALLDETTPEPRETRRELVESIRDQAERLERLVGNLLDLTRVNTASPQVAKQWCPLEEIASSAVARVERALGGRTVVVDAPDDVLLINVDPVLFEQVLVNLLENAAKYTPETATVRISGRRDGDQAVIQVADDGPGIPPGEEELIFERFRRSPQVRGTAGSGLGLTVCRAIVLAHGGTIRAGNGAAGGALFVITLPVDGAPADVASLPKDGDTLPR